MGRIVLTKGEDEDRKTVKGRGQAGAQDGTGTGGGTGDETGGGTPGDMAEG